MSTVFNKNNKHFGICQYINSLESKRRTKGIRTVQVGGLKQKDNST